MIRMSRIMMPDICRIFFILFICLRLTVAVPYSLYVWRDGWDPTKGCSETDFLNWKQGCLSHTWDTVEKTQWLWDTCKIPDREVDTLFVYDTLVTESDQFSCERTQYLRDTLREGRTQVPGLQVYSLFSDGGQGLPERNRVPAVVRYNEECATSDIEKLDGVAVSNGDFSPDWSQAKKIAYLDRLLEIKTNADKQLPQGSLKTHFTASYNWDGTAVDPTIANVTWRNVTQPAMRHLIDIFESLDIQVATVDPRQMRERMMLAQWEYAQSKGKRLHTTVYTTQPKSNHPSKTTFFPCMSDDQSCTQELGTVKTQDTMYSILDTFEGNLTGSKPCIDQFRAIYASGGYPGWPRPASSSGRSAHEMHRLHYAITGQVLMMVMVFMSM